MPLFGKVHLHTSGIRCNAPIRIDPPFQNPNVIEKRIKQQINPIFVSGNFGKIGNAGIFVIMVCKRDIRYFCFAIYTVTVIQGNQRQLRYIGTDFRL